MSLPRIVSNPLKRASVRLAHGQAASGDSPNLALFKEINKWGSQGKWDSVNNCPKTFLRGSDKHLVQGTYMKLKNSSEVFDASPKGQFLKLAFRVGLFIGCLFAVGKGYELIVPETYRLQYKYREKHHHEEHH
ncbi:hypothetical protein QR680_004948 [Steinernema hermaphroditum]|uniref:Uncharacterized protein n=1 Tax=Steinernema hermaphroditum TaxID=289476 RepID=A0AA39LUT1_9BILA|nr:hypothetical protein QR680_004948 [Steinernema hermaphroditum]